MYVVVRRIRCGDYATGRGLFDALYAANMRRNRRMAANRRDWRTIQGCDVLLRADPSPVVELNRGVAVAMRDGPEAGLRLIDAIWGRGELLTYYLAHSARAELCRRLGRIADAREAYARALTLTRQEPERRHLERRLRECSAARCPG